jgi:hypothetical protein
MSKLALTLFNMVEETMIVLGPFDNIQLTYGVIRPFFGDRYTDMELVPDKKNFYRYNGKKYSDFRIEVFDADKHKGIEMIGVETVEEAAQRLYPGVDRQVDRMLFINGAKWQADKFLKK